MAAEHFYYTAKFPIRQPRNHSFCVVHKLIFVILYNIDSCKTEIYVISYRHKEVIPMYR